MPQQLPKVLHLACPNCDAVNRLELKRLRDAPKCGQCHSQLFSGRPLVLSADSFLHHLAHTELPFLVDFWAPWCGPCRMMAPAFESVAVQLEPLLRLVKINTEESPALATKFAIRSIPTLILFQNGHERARQSGALDAQGIHAWLHEHLFR